MPLAAALLLSASLAAQAPERRVVLVTLDGLRWQELFSGADSILLQDTVATPDGGAARERFWRTPASARREALMPFLWGTVIHRGQVFGNRYAGGTMLVANGRKFSYPGYNEMLSGFPDDRIDSNDKVSNPNETVLEWLNRKPAFRGKVAVFSTWDVFPFIVNEERSGVQVNGGWERLDLPRPTERQRLLNELTASLFREWDSERWDALTYYAAKEYLLAERPRVLYIALGETDDWAHVRRYDRYLEAARQGDGFLQDLWETLQGLPEYRDRTTLIVTTDHGRGAGSSDWTDHGRDVVDAEYVWAAVMGPDTPALGSRDNVRDARQGQIAATLAAALKENFPAAVPQAEKPLPAFSR